MVSIQSSYTSPSKCKCSSPFGNLVSCSLLTSCFYSFNCLFCGDVMYGTSIVCLSTCTIIGITYTTIGTTNGSTLPFIIFYAFISMLSCSLFIPKLKAPPPSTLFFFLRAFLRDFAITFFLFSIIVYISSLVIFTLANGFYGFSFW